MIPPIGRSACRAPAHGPDNRLRRWASRFGTRFGPVEDRVVEVYAMPRSRRAVASSSRGSRRKGVAVILKFVDGVSQRQKPSWWLRSDDQELLSSFHHEVRPLLGIEAPPGRIARAAYGRHRTGCVRCRDPLATTAQGVQPPVHGQPILGSFKCGNPRWCCLESGGCHVLDVRRTGSWSSLETSSLGLTRTRAVTNIPCAEILRETTCWTSLANRLMICRTWTSQRSTHAPY